MKIIGIDPGAVNSGFVVYDAESETVLDKEIAPNICIAQLIENQRIPQSG